MDWMNFLGASFSLKVPTTWLVVSSPEYQTMFVSPPTAEKQHFTMTIFIQPYDETVPLAQLYETMNQSQQASYAQYTVLQSHEGYTDRQIPYFQRVFRWQQANGMGVLQTQTFFHKDGFVYILLSTRAEQTTEQTAQLADDIFANMVNTFAFQAIMFGG